MGDETGPQTGPAQLAQAMGAQREVYLFTVPKALCARTGVSEVGMYELRASDELLAAKAAGSDRLRLAHELATHSLASVNGARVSVADGSADAAWSKMSAPLRNMVLMAYAKIHNPEDDDTEGFLASQRVRVG